MAPFINAAALLSLGCAIANLAAADPTAAVAATKTITDFTTTSLVTCSCPTPSRTTTHTHINCSQECDSQFPTVRTTVYPKSCKHSDEADDEGDHLDAGAALAYAAAHHKKTTTTDVVTQPTCDCPSVTTVTKTHKPSCRCPPFFTYKTIKKTTCPTETKTVEVEANATL